MPLAASAARARTHHGIEEYVEIKQVMMAGVGAFKEP